MKTREARRDELAEEVCNDNCPWDSEIEEYYFGRDMFHWGSDAAVSELMPEIEKLVKALERSTAPCVGVDENNDCCGVTFTCRACNKSKETRSIIARFKGLIRDVK